MKTIVVDLDGTISDCNHRIPYAQRKEWDAFHSLSTRDKPHWDMVVPLMSAAKHNDLLLVTGRNQRYYDITVKWLMQHNLDWMFSRILMRGNKDYTRDGEMKLALLEKHYGSKEEVLRTVMLAIDDRDSVVEAFQQYGLNVWHVHKSQY